MTHRLIWTERITCALLLALLQGCALLREPHDYLSAPIKQYLTDFTLNPQQEQAMQEYSALSQHKGFAVSAAGKYGYSYLGDSRNAAARSALYWCQKYATTPCRLSDLNDVPWLQEYALYAEHSATLLSQLKSVDNRNYNLEGADWNEPAPTGLRRQATHRYDTRTPTTLPGIQTIRTVELVQRLRHDSPLLIDARGWTEERPETIPGAVLIDWAGTEELHIAGKEEALMANFRTVMELLAPDKSQPVVVFCHSAVCWLSVNAALRLQTLGYTQVLWYRGGLDAWRDAGLPILPSVPHATIYNQ